LSNSKSVEFPKVNLVSILAGAMCLISVFLPWWGLDGSVFGFSASIRWSLWTQPNFGGSTTSAPQAQAFQTLGWASAIVMILVLVSAAVALLGSFVPNNRYLIAGFVLSILAPLVYTGAVSYALAASCQGSSTCISGPVGAESLGGATVSWGFQSGFYLFVIGAILILVAVVFHRAFLQLISRAEHVKPPASAGAGFCSQCGSALASGAKFCSNCAQPVSSVKAL
jgi:hypothetical protein